MRGVTQIVPDKKKVTEPWGSAHSRTGANSQEQAEQFIEKYPVGTELDTEQLVEIGIELFPRDAGKPPLNASQVAAKLNAAGNHPRMGDNTFNLYSEPGSGGAWKVRSLFEEIDESNTVRDAFNAVRRSIDKLDSKLRGANLKLLPETTQEQIYASYRDCKVLGRTLARMLEDEQLSLADAAIEIVNPQLHNGGNGGGQKALKSSK